MDVDHGKHQEIADVNGCGAKPAIRAGFLLTVLLEATHIAFVEYHGKMRATVIPLLLGSPQRNHRILSKPCARSTCPTRMQVMMIRRTQLLHFVQLFLEKSPKQDDKVDYAEAHKKYREAQRKVHQTS